MGSNCWSWKTVWKTVRLKVSGERKSWQRNETRKLRSIKISEGELEPDDAIHCTSAEQLR